MIHSPKHISKQTQPSNTNLGKSISELACHVSQSVKKPGKQVTQIISMKCGLFALMSLTANVTITEFICVRCGEKLQISRVGGIRITVNPILSHCD